CSIDCTVVAIVVSSLWAGTSRETGCWNRSDRTERNYFSCAGTKKHDNCRATRGLPTFEKPKQHWKERAIPPMTVLGGAYRVT
ncbi:MAG TPA: hypothetical protein VGK57_10760, partial [Candidatus Binatia bacterium]